MKKFFLFFLVFIYFIPVYVLADTSKFSIVMDIDSGRVLYDNNSNQKRLIASTTNIMTT